MSVNEEELKQLDERIGKELGPFLDGVRTKRADYELFKRAYDYSQKKSYQIAPILGTLLRRRSMKPPNQLTEDFIELFAYMGFTEILGNHMVDIIIMLLVANGRDFHIECRGYRTPRIKHVVSIKADLEQEKIPLGTKIQFLEDNGIAGVTSVIDTKLRNDIAHMKFDVKYEGTEFTPIFEMDKKYRIYVKGKPATEIASICSQKLSHAYLTTWKLIGELAESKGLTKRRKAKA